MSAHAGIFIAHKNGTFTCDECIAEDEVPCARCDGTGTCDDYEDVYEGNCLECNGAGGLTLDPDDDDVETWREDSTGWLAPIACRCCKRSIPIVCDGVPTSDAREGLRLLREAREHFKRSPRTLDRLRYAIKSAEGAARHADLKTRSAARAPGAAS